MKNMLLLALSAGLLFAISAGLSLWLNPPQREETPATSAKAGAHKSKTTGEADEEKPRVPKAIIPPTPTADMTESARMADQLQGDLARVNKREEEFDRQQELYRFVLDDIRGEMEFLQGLWHRALQTPPPKPADPPKPGDAPKSTPTAPPPFMPTKDEPKKPEPVDPKALGKVTEISESMAPESAARIIEQMAKAGKIDAAVQLLAKMNPRQAARVLAAVTDEKLSLQMFEKLLETRQPPVGGP